MGLSAVEREKIYLARSMGLFEFRDLPSNPVSERIAVNLRQVSRFRSRLRWSGPWWVNLSAAMGGSATSSWLPTAAWIRRSCCAGVVALTILGVLLFWSLVGLIEQLAAAASGNRQTAVRPQFSAATKINSNRTSTCSNRLSLHRRTFRSGLCRAKAPSPPGLCGRRTERIREILSRAARGALPRHSCLLAGGVPQVQVVEYPRPDGIAEASIGRASRRGAGNWRS